MREIKFRIWGIQEKKYFQWDEVKLWQGLGFVLSGENNNYIHEQYTGLKDKEGKEIYEGDIVVIPDEYPYYDDCKLNYTGIVEWVFSGWQIVFKLVNKNKAGISDGVNQGYFEESSEHEVIGNIYENPELLQ